MPIPDQLSPVEGRLRAAVQDGKELDLRRGHDDADVLTGAQSWSLDRQIRGEVIAELALATGQDALAVPRAIRILGARITGALQLKHSKIEVPLLLEECYFDSAPDLQNCQLPSLSLSGSHLPAIYGYSLQVDGDLHLGGATAAKVCLFGARVSGRLWLTGATLGSSDGYALHAPDMTVSGGMYCGNGLTAEGGINLYGTTIGTALELTAATITRSQAGPALRADNIVTGSDLSCDRARISGGISLLGARIGGQVWLNELSLSSSDEWALSAPNATVGGGVYAGSGFTAHGGINLYAVTVGAGVELKRARLTAGSKRHALRVPHAKVAGNFDCSDGFQADGDIALMHADVRGRLSFQAADLGGSHAVQLDCKNAHIGELRLDDLASAPDRILLTGAVIQTLHDDPKCQPRLLGLDQTRYDKLHPQQPARQRIKWLGIGEPDYQPWRYEQLSAYYRRLGHDEEARTVQLAKQRRRRAQLHLPGRLWGWLQDGGVGYGYRPARAFGWLTLAIAGTASFFAVTPPVPSKAGHGPDFSALAYAVDTVLPILDLGQQQAFTPEGAGQWVAWAATLSGWLLATTVIAGVTRTLTRP